MRYVAHGHRAACPQAASPTDVLVLELPCTWCPSFPATHHVAFAHTQDGGGVHLWPSAAGASSAAAAAAAGAAGAQPPPLRWLQLRLPLLLLRPRRIPQGPALLCACGRNCEACIALTVHVANILGTAGLHLRSDGRGQRWTHKGKARLGRAKGLFQALKARHCSHAAASSASDPCATERRCRSAATPASMVGEKSSADEGWPTCAANSDHVTM